MLLALSLVLDLPLEVEDEEEEAAPPPPALPLLPGVRGATHGVDGMIQTHMGGVWG